MFDEIEHKLDRIVELENKGMPIDHPIIEQYTEELVEIVTKELLKKRGIEYAIHY